MGPAITATLAQDMIAAARAHARTLGGSFTIAVVDRAGVLLALSRMDGASIDSVRVAENKAYSAAGFKVSTEGWYDLIKGDAPLRSGAPFGIQRLVAIGGGYPIVTEGQVAGGIGVSGGEPRSEMEVAEAGLTATAGGDSVAVRLGRFVVDTRRHGGTSVAVRRHALRAIVNAVGAALAAATDETILGLRRWATGSGGGTDGTRSLWLGGNASIDRAAAVNAALIHHADFDDTHVPTVVHASAPVLGALLAEVQRAPVDGRTFIDSFAVGVEVEAAVAAMLMPDHYQRGFHVTATAGTVGAAAAVAYLHGLDQSQTAHALGLAAHRAAGLKEAIGSVAKAVNVGVAASSGVAAVEMARAGVLTAETVFEGQYGLVSTMTGYNRRRAEAGIVTLGAHWAVKELALKRYPTGVAMHAPLEGLLDLRERMNSDERAAVESFEFSVDPLVEEHWRAATGHQEEGRKLSSSLEAKFSFKYCMAVAWLTGVFDVTSTRESLYAQPACRELMDRIQIVADTSVTMNGCKVRLISSVGNVRTHTVIHHHGSPARRLSDDDINEKFRGIAFSVGAEIDTDLVLEELWKLESLSDVTPLVRLITETPH
jgi:2-methylcitrate dehydratase PrpD/uncharacterized protein GlcG (DUF336 family)